MPIAYRDPDPDTGSPPCASLTGVCAIDEAEGLRNWLRLHAWAARVDMEALTHLHTAVLQVLLIFHPRVARPPVAPFWRQWIWPLFPADDEESPPPQDRSHPVLILPEEDRPPTPLVAETGESPDFLATLADRIRRNRTYHLLIVDDSPTARHFMKQILEKYQIPVTEAENGLQALELLETDPSIWLVITDYNMPGMDGFEFVKQARIKHRRDRLSIIGMSAQGNNKLSAQFIRAGANDFLTKPFLEEELICRVNQNLENLELFQELRNAAVRDFLTGLYNRRYFFDAGNRIFGSFKRGQIQLVVAMADVDHFKKVNDTYGHDAGDAVLRVVAKLLQEHFRDTDLVARMGEADLVARMGGEEFCIILVNPDSAGALVSLECFRKKVEETLIRYESSELKVTVSIGVCLAKAETLEEMIRRADGALYRAKEGGRNRVVSDGS